MVVKAAPWAPIWVRFFVDTPLWARACVFIVASLSFIQIGGWFLLGIPALGLLFDQSERLVGRSDSVWCWADREHARSPYWFAWRLLDSPYWDFALFCVEKCSQYSMEGDAEQRRFWQDRLYRIYWIYSFPQQPVPSRTPAELDSFFSLYDN